jgi:hypothetical protein
MKRPLLIFMVLPIAVIAGCVAPARSSMTRDNESKEPVKTVEAQSAEYSSGAKSPLTFLDTLNHGRELSLSEGDVAVLDVGVSGGAPLKNIEVNEPRFRIQILASGRIDVVRQEKKNVEASTGLPVFMSSEQSLYKLYVGEFQTRDQAEAALPEIKKKGYQDAWIVKK